MTKDRKYKVVVSDRAKRMLGTHIRFMVQASKEAAAAKKKQLMIAMRSLSRNPQTCLLRKILINDGQIFIGFEVNVNKVLL